VAGLLAGCRNPLTEPLRNSTSVGALNLEIFSAPKYGTMCRPRWRWYSSIVVRYRPLPRDDLIQCSPASATVTL
jgi:hypothetical protein